MCEREATPGCKATSAYETLSEREAPSVCEIPSGGETALDYGTFSLTLSTLFSEGCVVQSGMPIKVWGMGAPNATIEIAFGDAETHATVDSQGRWSTTLPAHEPGGPYRMSVNMRSSGGNASGRVETEPQTIERNVYVGEVFVCAGQSNMEYEMASLHGRYPSEFERESDPLLRHCKVPVRYDFHKPCSDFGESLHWAGASAQTLDEFTAVGYFFGRMVREWLNVPVGLLNITLGGSPIESWMDEATLDGWPDALAKLEPYRSDAETQRRLDASQAAIAEWYDALRLDETDVAALRDRNCTTNAHASAVNTHTSVVNVRTSVDNTNAFAPDAHVSVANAHAPATNARESGANTTTSAVNASATDVSASSVSTASITVSTASSSSPQNFHWQPITLPSFFADAPDPALHGFRGSIYLHRTVTVPHYGADQPAMLHLGTMVDTDVTYVNGVKVGHTDYEHPLRDYAIPAGILHAGRNDIVIRLVVERGLGRVTPGKRMYLQVGDDEFDLSGVWSYAIGRTAPNNRPDEDCVRWNPMGLYNGMVAPCAGYAARAVLWYQGESSAGNDAHDYGRKLRAMIECWRRAWGQERLPFLITQLTGFSIDSVEDGGWSEVRDCQWRAAADIPDVATAVTLDAGEWNDLHPQNKRLVAGRLFIAAQRLVYGRSDVYPSPSPSAVQFDGEVLRITFDDGSGDCGLDTLDGSEPGEFELVWPDGSVLAVDARIVGNDVVIDVPWRRPASVRYAWRNAPDRGLLCSRDGLPVSPFVSPIQVAPIQR